MSEDESECECKDTAASQEILRLLENLHCGSASTDKSLVTLAEQTLDLLQDHAALSEAQEMLAERS